MSSLPDYLIPSVERAMTQEAPSIGPLYKALTDGPVALKLIRVYKRLDEMMSDSANAIDCKEGCNYCCHYHIYVTPAEVFAIAEEISKRPEVERKRVQDSIRKYVEQVRGWGRDKHIYTNIACTFLHDGKCSIYSIRPLACRRHHSADVGVCRRTFDDAHSQEQSPMDPDRIIASTAMENLHVHFHHGLGLDCSSYEFHAALFEALTNKASFKRWKSGKSAFPSVQDKSGIRILPLKPLSNCSQFA